MPSRGWYSKDESGRGTVIEVVAPSKKNDDEKKQRRRISWLFGTLEDDMRDSEREAQELSAVQRAGLGSSRTDVVAVPIRYKNEYRPKMNVGPLRGLFHLLAACHCWYACYYDWWYVNIPPDVTRFGVDLGKTNKLKFLTFWNALLQASFFTLCFFNDVMGFNQEGLVYRRLPSTRKLQDLMMSCLVFPITMFVGLTFWALYLCDRELVLPKAIDPYFPTWLNHCMHTNIVILATIELVTARRRYPSRMTGVGVLSSAMLLYLAWVHVIHHYTDHWVYPVLDILELPARMVFFASLLGMAVSLYFIGEQLNKRLWDEKSGEKVRRD